MEHSKFFRIVWKFNALVIALSGVLAVGLLSIGVYEIVKDLTREHSVANIVNVEQGSNKVSTNWQFGFIKRMEGYNVGAIALQSDQPYTKGYFSKSAYSERNYLFINFDDNSQQWLFDHNDYLIDSFDKLYVDKNDTNSPVAAIAYTVVKQDSDSDGYITRIDKSTFALSKPDGSGYTEVITDIDKLIDTEQIDSSKLVVVYTAAGVEYIAKVDLNSFVAEEINELYKVN